jgi:hypothetical protein
MIDSTALRLVLQTYNSLGDYQQEYERLYLAEFDKELARALDIGLGDGKHRQ